MENHSFKLIWPHVEIVPSYQAALQRGWSRNNITSERTRLQDLEKIHADPQAFVDGLVDLQGRGGDVQMPDGSFVPKLPGYTRWVVTDRNGITEFVGTINFRHTPGTSSLPSYCLGHVGYSVVPWMAGRGVATFALQRLIVEAQEMGHLRGMDYLEITTQPDNAASQAVILKCSGALIERFIEPHMYGGHEGLRFRIPLVKT